MTKAKTTAAKAKPATQRETEITQATVLRGLLNEATGEGVAGTTPASRISAWKALGEHLGLFSNKLEVTGKVSLDELVLEAARAKAERDRRGG